MRLWKENICLDYVMPDYNPVSSLNTNKIASTVWFKFYCFQIVNANSKQRLSSLVPQLSVHWASVLEYYVVF